MIKMDNNNFANNFSNILIGVEQLKESMKPTVEIVSFYYKELKENGFNDEQAFKLAELFHKKLLGMG